MKKKPLRASLNQLGFINKIKWVLYFSVLLIILYNIGTTIYAHKESYLYRNYWQRYPQLRSYYVNSQYVRKHNPIIIPDEVINAYAAGNYIKGESPVLIGADTPPLGRYLIGLSILLFNNESLIIIFFGGASLILMYLLGRQIFKYSFFALAPPLFVSFEPIFKNQFAYVPLLDIMQLFFLLCSMYFINNSFRKKEHNLRYFVLAGLFLGFFISTKFYATGVTIVASWLAVAIVHKNMDNVKKTFLTIPIAILVLLSTYIRVFSYKSYTLFSYLGIQKYIFLYHKTQLILPFSIWPLMLLNRWYVWFGNKPILSDPQWLPTWPLMTILSFITIILYLMRKIPRKIELEVLMGWIFFYFFFFSFGQISARYFVILIPVLYLISFYSIENFFVLYLKKRS